LDVRDYGTIGPCPGQGAVRCIDIYLESIGEAVVPYVPEVSVLCACAK